MQANSDYPSLKRKRRKPRTILRLRFLKLHTKKKPGILCLKTLFVIRI